MGQLMNIVGPLLLLGGAVFVVAKRCELLGMCGETPPDSGDTSTVEVPEGMTVDEATDGVGKLTGGQSGCCTCEARGEGGKIHCHTGDGNWFNPAAGSGGSNDFNMSLSLIECNKTCGGSSSSNATSGKSPTTDEEIEEYNKKPTIAQNPKTSDYRSTRASSPGTRTRNTVSKAQVDRYVNANPGGYKPGGGTYYTYRPVYRSYFADPYNPRPFRLFHRIAN